MSHLISFSSSSKTTKLLLLAKVLTLLPGRSGLTVPRDIVSTPLLWSRSGCGCGHLLHHCWVLCFKRVLLPFRCWKGLAINTRMTISLLVSFPHLWYQIIHIFGGGMYILMGSHCICAIRGQISYIDKPPQFATLGCISLK